MRTGRPCKPCAAARICSRARRSRVSAATNRARRRRRTSHRWQQRREPSRLAPGPAGSWPLDYTALVQPVLDRRCVSCHQPAAEGQEFDLTPAKSYDNLVSFGSPSLKDLVITRWKEQRSTAGAWKRKPIPSSAFSSRGTTTSHSRPTSGTHSLPGWTPLASAQEASARSKRKNSANSAAAWLRCSAVPE